MNKSDRICMNLYAIATSIIFLWVFRFNSFVIAALIVGAIILACFEDGFPSLGILFLIVFIVAGNICLFFSDVVFFGAADRFRICGIICDIEIAIRILNAIRKLVLKIHSSFEKKREEKRKIQEGYYREAIVKKIEDDVFRYSIAMQDTQNSLSDLNRTQNLINLLDKCSRSDRLQTMFLDSCDGAIASYVGELQNKYKSIRFPNTLDELNTVSDTLKNRITVLNKFKSEINEYGLKELKSIRASQNNNTLFRNKDKL